MNRNIKALIILFILLLISPCAWAVNNEPIALLIQAKGKVTYTTDGKTWKLISRNKFLYEDDRIKTHETGQCKLINRETDMLQPINSNTEIRVSRKGIKVLTGDIPEAESSGDIISFLKRKFAKVQKYTVVKRNGKSLLNNYLQVASTITLSEAYPEIVWENLGPDYSYELVIDGKTFNVPESSGYMVRFKPGNMISGTFDYYVNVFYKGELLYIPKVKGNLRWLSETENQLFQKKVSRVHQIAEDNGFLLGNIMDEHGLKVAAMYEFQKFLSENPDINEARPFLIKIYNDLKLNKMKQNETVLYHHNRISSN